MEYAMTYTYEEVVDLEGQIRSDVIRRIEDDAIIPKDPANADYQAYLNRDNPDWGKPLL
jgi:hypothetical protein